MREDWIECKLGDILTVSSGKGLPASKMKAGKFPVYGGNGISGYHSDFLFEDIKLIIGRVGAKCGVVHITQPNSWVTDNALVVNFNFEKPNLKFFKLLLEIENLNKLSNSTAQPVISGAKIYEYGILLPPLPEQRAIVKKLESLFSSLDAGVADLKKAQQQLKIYRQAVLKKAFEEEKREQKLINISDAIGGFAFKSPDFLEKGNYQVIRIGNIRPDLIRLDSNPVFINELNDKTKKYLLKDNDIVISLTGTRNKRDYGFSALVKNENLLLNQRLAAIRFDKDCNPKYYLHYFSTDYFKDDFFSAETGNTGQGNVGMNAIKETLVPFPSLVNQNQIVKHIESRLSVCDSIEQNIKESLEKAEALRKSILKKAFEGNLLTAQELAECKQAADYEPASILLERIKKSKK
ncbi:restriction endonuclease subunit S [Pedobacter chitinilyticus]|uniref:Type I restriction modification DNA specificity domain-containing protein n=1 Tax=Pedobacter chitinilyticus TaxID=2233776 RepID=A0A443Z203_9SPHI|nr:restriction endonuclease subunit S [Pedobacter chitinilyticus]RWU10568.1 hypothetical protein DPV69_04310 [Pedobacter chitinilyticus]